MRASTSLSVVVRRSPCLTVCVSGFIAGAAVALYLVVCSLTGPDAGCVAALVTVALLGFGSHAQARRQPRWFRLAADGSLRWVDRSGRRGSGVVVAANRVGGCWVTLGMRPSDVLSRLPHQGVRVGCPTTVVSPRPGHAVQRSGRFGSRLTQWLVSRYVSRAASAWLIPADALERDTFRMLAARVRRLDGGR